MIIVFIRYLLLQNCLVRFIMNAYGIGQATVEVYKEDHRAD